MMLSEFSLLPRTVECYMDLRSYCVTHLCVFWKVHGRLLLLIAGIST